MEAVAPEEPSSGPKPIPQDAGGDNGAALEEARKEKEPKETETNTDTKKAGSIEEGAKGGVRLAPVSRKRSVQRRGRQNSIRNAKNSTEELRKRSRAASSGNIASDGTSAGRTGRQFTVGNVGNNGMIYLRPVIRPVQQRLEQPSFVFPFFRKPSAVAKQSSRSSELFTDSPWSQASRTPGIMTRRASDSSSQVPPQPQYFQRPTYTHQRSHSFSTINENTHHHSRNPEGLRIVIHRADGEPERPQTADGPNSIPTLEVPIPHYRLGTPRFSVRGTAILRSSAYTRESTTEDMNSSIFSKGDYNRLFPIPPGMAQTSHYDHTLFLHDSTQRSSSFSRITPNSYCGQLIGPGVYDALSGKLDDSSVVRYSPVNGEIVAATIPRLIVQITSCKFLDYDLLSDFFLTFRSFLSTYELVDYLLARLQWAVDRAESCGRVIRVRTFVALRHWILNYFVDDFVPDFNLRKLFCDQVNLLCQRLQQRADGGGGDLKILGELKKCWRRTSCLYWDEPNICSDGDPIDDILPGGAVGSRELRTPSFAHLAHHDLNAVPPTVDTVLQSGSNAPSRIFATENSQRSDEQLNASHQRSGSVPSVRMSPETAEQPISPKSDRSLQVMSCSIPAKGYKHAASRFAPRPVPVTDIAMVRNTATAASIPPAVGKPVRPVQIHKKSGSFSDALRDSRAPISLQKAIFHSTHSLTPLPFGGSLVRGNILPPGQPHVAGIAPSSPLEQAPNFDLNTMDVARVLAGSIRPIPGTSPGVKRLLGSVRRALSTKQSGSQVSNATDGTDPGASAHKRLGVPMYSPEKATKKTRTASTSRIDVLGARTAETFKEVMRENAEAERRPSAASEHSSQSQLDPSPLPLDNQPIYLQPSHISQAPSGVSMTSESIVIVDDTGPDYAIRSGTLPNEPLLEVRTDSPTPARPITPPQETDQTSLKSSPNNTEQDLPGSISGRYFFEPSPSIASRLHRAHSTSMSQRYSERSSSSRTKPPFFGRGKSFNSVRSASMSIGRYASFQSGMPKHGAAPSFDATTASYSLEDSSNDSAEKPAAPTLRRRPGGDLRAAQHVQDLHSLTRSRSTGSLTYSHSLQGSMIPSSPLSPRETRYSDSLSPTLKNCSLGALAETSLKRPLTLVETHSSQPNMRPSFEAQVAKLAQLPDDDDEDGGIECALLKLEGKYKSRASRRSLEQTFGQERNHLSYVSDSAPPSDSRTSDYDTASKRQRRNQRIASSQLIQSSIAPEGQTVHVREIDPSDASVRDSEYRKSLGNVRYSPRSSGSGDSYCSIPLLDRGLSDGSLSIQQTSGKWSLPSAPEPPVSNWQSLVVSNPTSSHPSFEYIEETESMQRIPRGSTLPDETAGEEPPLSEDCGSASDLSSELSIEVVSNSADEHGKTLAHAGSGLIVSELGLVSHPLRHPPSPPLTLDPTLPKSPEPNQMGYQHQLPTPQLTPTNRGSRGVSYSQKVSKESTLGLAKTGRDTSVLKESASHLPFILAFDSQVLAEQLTLIEKDALNEIDWKELAELRWKQDTPPVRDWVEFLRTGAPQGVEMVVGRFNLMVKWAVSECLLTRDIKERARTIVKYIHIAAYARKYHNYATMYQITMALLSADCAKLSKTWELVPAADLRTFKELESLVQPTRNFHNLRTEMETITGEEGCVPFIGLYIHDLLFNAQKPADFPGPRVDEALINFERHRAAASIIKNLLRLLESTNKYSFRPVEGVIDRCLWMSALSDDEIRVLGQELE
ncbi:MAG: hypothetical protein M1819_000469 [Sarea resinae]|nr:MAG: hypothetical protein M1819_000469 [Sarea resinae]